MDLALHKIHLLWRQTYYSDLLVILLSIYFLYRLAFIKTNSSFHKYAILFYASTLVLFLSTVVFYIFIPAFREAIKYTEIFNFLFGCIEILVFKSFFLHIPLFLPFKPQITVIGFVTFSILLLFAIYALTYKCSSTPMAHNNVHQLQKFEESSDVIKRFILLTPCLYYFYRIFKKNQNFLFQEALIIYSLFSYCILGILSYSIAVNIGSYKSLRDIITTFPSIALNLLLITIYNYLTSTHKNESFCQE